MSNRYLQVAILALAVATMVGGKCEGKGPDYFDLVGGDLDPFTGDIFGRVTVDGTPQSGVTVMVLQGGTLVGTQVTDANGEYEFLELDPGTYTVSTSTITGADCPGAQSATVFEDDETQVNFACTTTPATTGTLTVDVSVGGSPQSGATVQIAGPITRTATTDASGTATFSDLPEGQYTATTTLSGHDCPEASGTVEADETTNVDVACTQQGTGDFTVTLMDPPPSYRHIGPGSSETCTGFGTNPMQPGGTYTAMWSGPGTVGSTMRTGTLDAMGKGIDRQPINAFGTYNVNLSVTAGGVTRMASGTVNVTSAQGTCPSVVSSARFKRDVIGLTPGGRSILGLRPVAFRYLHPYGDPAIPQLGLIAEEVVRTYPGAIELDRLGRPHGIYYSTLMGLVLEEVEARAARSVEVAVARLAETL